MENMKELVIDIVKALVDNPDEVTVEETRKKGEIILKLSVSQDPLQACRFSPVHTEQTS